MPSQALTDGRLQNLDPVHELRSIFQYSNTGWGIAGEVLRVASNETDWCAALHALVLVPMELNYTFCHRNEIPDDIAAKHLASVHKMDPCNSHMSFYNDAKVDTGVGVATYSFVKTGEPTDFAWGAADAAGSVLSCAADMSSVIQLLLGSSFKHTNFLKPETVAEMLSAQMVVTESWLQNCGLSSQSTPEAGAAAAAGLGFDVVGSVFKDSNGRMIRYAEKNGDTSMHKARLGLAVGNGEAVLLMSNLGGEMGGMLTGLKFGTMQVLAGASDQEAQDVTFNVLEDTNFWKKQWIPENTCNACGRADYSGPCFPGNREDPPMPLPAYVGKYSNNVYGLEQSINLFVSPDSTELFVNFGPIQNQLLTFDEKSMYYSDIACSDLPGLLQERSILQIWSSIIPTLLKDNGQCEFAEFTMQAEIMEAGVSASQGKVAFPWGGGIVPLPDGPSFYIISQNQKVQHVVFNGVAFNR